MLLLKDYFFIPRCVDTDRHYRKLHMIYISIMLTGNMEDLIASLSQLKIVYPEQTKSTMGFSNQLLGKTVCHLYHENIQLKQEIFRLRSLLEVVNNPRLPEWVK